MRAACPVHLIFLTLIALIHGEKYKLWSSSLRNFLHLWVQISCVCVLPERPIKIPSHEEKKWVSKWLKVMEIVRMCLPTARAGSPSRRKDTSFKENEGRASNESRFLPVRVLPTASGDSEGAHQLLRAVSIVAILIRVLIRFRGWNFSNHRHWPWATCHATKYPEQGKASS
jgi:hypothetical protein